MKNTEPDTLSQSLFKGLQALSDLSFPKKCATCGMRYDTVEDFISKTRALRKSTGLKEERDDEDQIIVELFRNCTCGSTLMDEFNNRRDLSEAGLKRRETFEQIMERLMAAGHARKVARQELLNIMRGQGSRLLKVKKRQTGRDKTRTQKKSTLSLFGRQMKKRILFVDDEPNILKGLQRSLRPMRNDWDMSFAQGPESALEFLAHASFDVIVSDMNMPGMNGESLMAIVKEEHPQMYRILLSGNCESGAPLYGADDMAHYFLSKPCEKASLIQVINQSGMPRK